MQRYALERGEKGEAIVTFYVRYKTSADAKAAVGAKGCEYTIPGEKGIPKSAQIRKGTRRTQGMSSVSDLVATKIR